MNNGQRLHSIIIGIGQKSM